MRILDLHQLIYSEISNLISYRISHGLPVFQNQAMHKDPLEAKLLFLIKVELTISNIQTYPSVTAVQFIDKYKNYNLENARYIILDSVLFSLVPIRRLQLPPTRLRALQRKPPNSHKLYQTNIVKTTFCFQYNINFKRIMCFFL